LISRGEGFEDEKIFNYTMYQHAKVLETVYLTYDRIW